MSGKDCAFSFHIKIREDLLDRTVTPWFMGDLTNG